MKDVQIDTQDIYSGELVAYTYMKDFHIDMPDPLNGRLTARPSGKFCIPIPKARFLKEKNIYMYKQDVYIQYDLSCDLH